MPWRRSVKSSLPEVRPVESVPDVDRRSLLRGCALFSTLGDLELDDLAESAVLVHAGEGDTVFRQGEPGEHLYIIVSGTVRLSATTEGGLEQPIALQGPASCIGEMALLDGEPRSASGVAARPAKLLRVGREELEAMLRRHPAAREKFLREGVSLVSSRLRSANERYWSLAGRSLRARAGAAHARSRLASLMSHEFRTPLTVIKSSAQRMRFGAPAAENPLIEKIEHQCGRLEILVDDLIALALLQSSAAVQELADVDLAEVAAEVALEMSRPARRKGLRLSVPETKGDAVVAADRSLVRRALRHLVDNAVKFSSEGEILIEARAGAGGVCRLSVRDHGIGVEAGALERLSSSFVQEQDPHNRDVEGLGIGLALVTEVAKVHGGRLVVESTPGAGSLFALELPLKPGETPESLETPEKKEQRQ
jgi:signal transduction histidine kinase